MKHVPYFGAGKELIASLDRYAGVVIRDRDAARSIRAQAWELRVPVSIRKISRHGWRLSCPNRQPGVRSRIYGANKEAVARLDREGSITVPCANAAECIRAAAARIGLRVSVRTIGRGPWRTITVAARTLAKQPTQQATNQPAKLAA